MMLNTTTSGAHNASQPFFFRKRVEKIDWRRLAAVDVNRVASQMDIDTLQEILTSVAFCDITNEIDNRYVDPNFIKLFQLAQLLVEYLLYSQDYLTNNMNAIKDENEKLKKNTERLEQELKEKSSRLAAVRRECHRRRLLLLAQQQLMDSGPQSYHRCLYCPKAFLNASFLAAHVHRRHPEFEHITPAQPTQVKPVSQETVPIQTVGTQNNNTVTALEQDVRELLNRLKTSPTMVYPQPVSPKRQKIAREIESPSEISRSAEDLRARRKKESPVKGRSSPTDWQKVMTEQHRKDMEQLKLTFEKELQDLQEQHKATKAELSELKLKRDIVPKAILDDRPKFSPQRERMIMHASAAIAAAAPVQSTSVHAANLSVVDEETTTNSSRLLASDRPQTPRTRTPDSSRRSPRPVESINQPIVTDIDDDDDRDEDDSRTREQKEAMRGIQPIPRSASPNARSQDPNSNVLRYSRLLDQLRSDPETLRGLRYEVERLLSEQLVERGIAATQTRLSDDQLTERLAAQRRERERLSRKHVDFLAIRENLARQVDRLARAALNERHRPGSKEALNSSLPPHHSPAANTLPRMRKRTPVQSPRGHSMPSLTSATRGASRSESVASSPSRSEGKQGRGGTRPRLQRSSPQLYQHKPTERNVNPTSSLTETPVRTMADTRESSKYSINETSERNPSPSRIIHKPPPSPEVPFSHSQRVVTFDQLKDDVTSERRIAVEDLSTEEWDSESEDLGPDTGQPTPTTQTRRAQPVPEDLDLELDEANQLVAGRQQNTNAPLIAQRSGRQLFDKSLSVKTDDEDICSVSSINNPDDIEEFSFSLSRGRRTPLDPEVAAARAHSASLGPRPITRFGTSSGRSTKSPESRQRKGDRSI